MTSKLLNSPNNGNAELSVGIVGAGFAGLALANLLLATTHSNKNEAIIRIQVMERRRKLDCTNLHHKGAIRLAITTFSSLQSKLIHFSKEDWNSVVLCANDDDPSVVVVDRYKFLSLLQRSIPIHYECPIISFRQHHDPRRQYCLLDHQGHSYGPFDIVVAADGVFSTFRRRENHPLLRRHTARRYTSACATTTHIALLGDARWVADIFWDFGRTRIQQGANLALNDAMEFLPLLLHPIMKLSKEQQQQQQHPMEDHGTKMTQYHFGKFDIAFCLEQREKIRKRFGMVLVIILLLFMYFKAQPNVVHKSWPFVV